MFPRRLDLCGFSRAVWRRRSMSADPSKRLRFGTTKSRNGCLPCKRKHVKCDEARPACQRCRRGARACTWASCKAATKVLHHEPGTPPSAITLVPESGARDRQALEYFAVRTAGQLIGTWGASKWTSTILQSAMTEPSIQRVSMALGALYRMHEFGFGDQQYALGQYVTALRMVRLAGMTEVLLLACLLFCAFECMN